MDVRRREFLKFAAGGLVATHALADPIRSPLAHDAHSPTLFNVRSFGAAADGKTVDTPAVNRAIAVAAATGGGTVNFPAGVYLCNSIRLKSFVALHLEPGAVILAAPAGDYDAAEPNEPFESYQDFGPNHWHNSLVVGEVFLSLPAAEPFVVQNVTAPAAVKSDPATWKRRRRDPSALSLFPMMLPP